MLGAKGGVNQALERLPSFSPCREFQFPPQESQVAQHACVLHPALWVEAEGKLAPTVQVSKMVSAPSMSPSVNHSSLLKTNRAAAVSSGCSQNHCGPSKPLSLLAQRTGNSLPDEPGNGNTQR